MQIISLNYRYKGDRNYVHGTDVYTTVAQCLSEHYDLSLLRRLRFKFRKLITRQCDLCFGQLDEHIAVPSTAVVDIYAKLEDKFLYAYLIEHTKAVLERYPYDEERIKDLCTVAAESISISAHSGYSPIEVIVAMNKILHNILIRLKTGKWLFSQLDLLRMLTLNDATGIQIKMIHNFNNSLTKSVIFSDGELIGHIYFSVGSA